MSYKSNFLKTAIKCTPDMMTKWVANHILKGIVEFSLLNFDLDTRKAHIQATLYGETEMIEVLLDGFAIISEENSHKLILQQAQSNRPWLTNVFARIVGKAWKIPNIPQFQGYIELAAELLKPLSTEEEAEPENELTDSAEL
jgi:hypothetical protein